MKKKKTRRKTIINECLVKRKGNIEGREEMFLRSGREREEIKTVIR